MPYSFVFDVCRITTLSVAKGTWCCDKWVPVTTAWRVLRLRTEERLPIWRVAANILNKQSRTADEGWSSSLGFGEVLTTPPRGKPLLRNIHNVRCFLWRQNNLELKYSPTRISGGGGGGGGGGFFWGGNDHGR